MQKESDGRGDEIVALVAGGTWMAGGFAAQPAEPPAVAPMARTSGAPVVAAETPAATPAERTELAAPVTPASSPRVRVVDALSEAPEPYAEVRLFPPDREPDVDSELARELRRGEVDDLEMPFLVGQRVPLDDQASLPTPSKRPAMLMARHGERMGMLALRHPTADDAILRLWPLRKVRARVIDADGRAAHGVPVMLRLNRPGQALPCNLSPRQAIAKLEKD